MTEADRPLRSVFVGNIPYEVTEEKLKEIFSEVGPVVSLKLVYDRETGKPKGYGFCEYKDVETAMSAMRNLNGFEINNRILRVDNAGAERSRMAEIGPSRPENEVRTVEEPVGPERAPEAISKAVASLPPEQMFELMRQMKACIQNNHNEARTMLLQNPQLSYALLQALVVMKIVDPTTALSLLHKDNAVPVGTLLPEGQMSLLPTVTPPKPPPSENPWIAAGAAPPQVSVMPMNQNAAPFGTDLDLRDPRLGRNAEPNQRQGQDFDLRGERLSRNNASSDPRNSNQTNQDFDLRAGFDPRTRPMGGDRDMRDNVRDNARDRDMRDPRAAPDRDPRRRNDQAAAVATGKTLGALGGGIGMAGFGPGATDQEKAALIMQVLQLSEEQIAVLPPEQRQSILVLKEQIAKSTPATR